jgi:hypothetical protein
MSALLGSPSPPAGSAVSPLSTGSIWPRLDLLLRHVGRQDRPLVVVDPGPAAARQFGFRGH